MLNKPSIAWPFEDRSKFIPLFDVKETCRFYIIEREREREGEGRECICVCNSEKKYGTLHEFACHPCAGAMLIFSVSFQF